MYTLYYAPGAASMVIHWLLLDAGLEFEARRVDLQAAEHKQPEYLALNPRGVVPTLVHDGKAHAETAALLLWLAARHPDVIYTPPMLSDAFPVFLQRMIRLANTLQPNFRTWFYPHEPAGEEHAALVKERVRAVIEAEWAQWAEECMSESGYLFGEQPTVLDFYLAMLMRWSRNMPKPATDWPQLARHAALMKQRPSFAELYRREGLTEWA